MDGLSFGSRRAIAHRAVPRLGRTPTSSSNKRISASAVAGLGRPWLAYATGGLVEGLIGDHSARLAALIGSHESSNGLRLGAQDEGLLFLTLPERQRSW